MVEIKAESNSPDVAAAAAAAACRHFAAPALRITAFTLRLKNSPSVIIYLAGARHLGIVLPENGSNAPPALSVSHFLPVYFTHRVPLLAVYLQLRAKKLPLKIKTGEIETASRSRGEEAAVEFLLPSSAFETHGCISSRMSATGIPARREKIFHVLKKRGNDWHRRQSSQPRWKNVFMIRCWDVKLIENEATRKILLPILDPTVFLIFSPFPKSKGLWLCPKLPYSEQWARKK